LAFSASSLRSAAPVTANYTWNIFDPNGGPLTCTLDVDDDGTIERTITPCDSGNVGVANFTTAGTRTARLTVSDGVFAPVTATSSVLVDAGPSEPYGITLRLDPSTNPIYANAFALAAVRWAEVITAGVPDQYAEIGPVPLIYPWIPPFAGVIDDVLIDARVVPLDGPGQILGRASSLGVRNGGSGLPYWGVMEFDADDLADLAAEGTLNAVILHEMAHVLGLGPSWILRGMIGGPLGDPRFTGLGATAEWQQLGGIGQPPIEDDGGPGTMLVHWRDETFGNELVTGYLSALPNPLSRMTIASLADLGYGVNFAAADPYALPSNWGYIVDADDQRRPSRELRMEWIIP